MMQLRSGIVGHVNSWTDETEFAKWTRFSCGLRQRQKDARNSNRVVGGRLSKPNLDLCPDTADADRNGVGVAMKFSRDAQPLLTPGSARKIHSRICELPY